VKNYRTVGLVYSQTLTETQHKVGQTVYTLSPKNIPDIIGRNLKKGDQILIVSGTNIPDTTGYRTIVQVPTPPGVCSCTTWGNWYKEILHF